MKHNMRFWLLAFLLAMPLTLFPQGSTGAQDRETMAVLPFSSPGLDRDSARTTYFLLTQEITKLEKYVLIGEERIFDVMESPTCAGIVCALEAGRMLDADKVVYGSMNKLGDKVIFQYTLVDVAGEHIIFTDNMTALEIEEFDTITKRVASQIVNLTPAKDSVEIGLVTKREMEQPEMRTAIPSGGISFGYLYPTAGYDASEKIFALDFRSMYETQNFAVHGIFGIRDGIVLNIGANYLFSRKDLCPYLGGAFGFHWVSHDWDDPEERRSDGFEVIASTGIMAFRTYNFRVMMNLDYSITFNDYDDQAIVLTLGIQRIDKKFFGLF